MSSEKKSDGRASHGERWFIDPPRQAPDGTIRAHSRISSDSPWFSGHFPGEPILPGIAQLALVSEAVRALCPARMRVAGMRRVRFRQVVKPDDCLKITVTPPSGNRTGFAFRVRVENAVVCSGTLDMV